ncbi:transposase [Streptomyces tendae]|uniref:helix-turn-helix domain-containing protein n=1 Tax=Streptomyces tendae TaxID=1932 RepID=UPI003712A4C1
MIQFVSSEALWIVGQCVNLSSEQTVELRALMADRHVTADVALRARIVLWAGEGRRRKDVAELAGVSARTVDRTRTRYTEHGLAGLVEKKRGGGKDQVPPQTRG